MEKTLPFYALMLFCVSMFAQDPPTKSPAETAIDKTIYKILDIDPSFSGCGLIEDKNERYSCDFDLTKQFFIDSIRQPELIVADGNNCYAEAKIIIEPDGVISDAELTKKSGDECGEELLRLIKLMPPMSPGILDGKQVRSQKMINYRIDKEGNVRNGGNEIFKVVEGQPMFPGCEMIKYKSEKKKCSDEKLNEFIYSNIQYPSEAKKNGVEGMIVVKFIVEPDGSISNAEVVRDIGAGLGDEALRIVRLMPAWEEGRQRGRPVRVQFNLPIKFSLEDEKVREKSRNRKN